jgi:phospholipid N-methyltransferase
MNAHSAGVPENEMLIFVIASIPFSFLSRDKRAKHVVSVYSLLADDSDFVIFHQFSPMMRSWLKTRFPYVRVQFESLNIFPCFLILSQKQVRDPTSSV